MVYGVASGSAELIDARIGTDGLPYPNVGSAIRTQFNNVNSDLNQLFSFDTQYLISANCITGKVYSQNTTIDSSGDVIFPVFRISGGKTYYYRHLRGIFCWYKNIVTGAWTQMSTSDVEIAGTLTPTNDCYVYISVSSNNKTLATFSTTELTDSTRVEGKYNYELKYPDYFQQKVIYCGADKEFTTFKSALLEATRYQNAILYLEDGVYDIFLEEGGNTFF